MTIKRHVIKQVYTQLDRIAVYELFTYLFFLMSCRVISAKDLALNDLEVGKADKDRRGISQCYKRNIFPQKKFF